MVPFWTGAPKDSVAHDAWKAGFERGHEAALNCELEEEQQDPEEDERDPWIEAATEAEQHGRQYSPFEHFAALLNRLPEDEADRAWEEFEQGVQRGILAGLDERFVEGLGEFYDSFIETALWSTTDNSRDDGGDSLDERFGPDDVHPGTRLYLLADCAGFLTQFEDQIGDRYAQAGADFWLTRNGHGSGFWDGGWPDVGRELTEGSKPWGSVDLYEHEGEVYAMGAEPPKWDGPPSSRERITDLEDQVRDLEGKLENERAGHST